MVLLIWLMWGVLGSSEGCDLIEKRPLNCEEIKETLSYHNEKRNLLASASETKSPGSPLGPAEDMLEMRWDSELAKASQAWAERCQFKHSHVPGEGENLGYMTFQERTPLTKIMSNWYNELHTVGYSGRGFEQGVGHYSQMIWAKSGMLGCGASFYESKGHTTFLVCRYKPAGNVIDTDAYAKGERNCSKHGLHNSIKYSHLCSELSADDQGTYDPCSSALHTFPSPTLVYIFSVVSFIKILS